MLCPHWSASVIITVLLLVTTSTCGMLEGIVQDIEEETISRFLGSRQGFLHQLKNLNNFTGTLKNEDVVLTTPELIKKYGYPSESHDIVTEDGYILTFHRIPHGKNNTKKTPNPRPLYLQHGILSSSDDWIVTGPEKGFGYVLADAGYDVWMGNARGNKWSRRHVKLDPEKSEFWQFSWHEMGIYDVPAAVDYILEATGKESLYYVGYSMGATMFLVLNSMRPEYNSKFRASALLAPAVFFAHMNDLLKTMFIQIVALAEFMGKDEVFPHTPLYGLLSDSVCRDGDWTQAACLTIVGLTGISLEKMNATLLPVHLGHFPSGTSTKTFKHYIQSIKTGEFRQFDYGVQENFHKYGIAKPPKYNLTEVVAPVIVHYSQGDVAATPQDVLTLISILPNVINVSVVSNEKFKHVDFFLAVQAKELVYDVVISQLSAL